MVSLSIELVWSYVSWSHSEERSEGNWGKFCFILPQVYGFLQASIHFTFVKDSRRKRKSHDLEVPLQNCVCYLNVNRGTKVQP